MKKIVCILGFILVLSNFVVAQENAKNEISFKCGIFPILEYGFSLMSVNVPQEKMEHISLPTFSVEYLRYLNSKNALGFSVSYGCPVINVSKNPTLVTSYFALQGKYRFVYLSKENFNLYGEVGLGSDLFISDYDVFPFFAGQLSPIGISFGSDKFFGNAEIGIGTEGSFLLLGCGFRF